MYLGHAQLFSELRSRSAQGTLQHAQLFLGPAHVGKTKMALRLSVFLQGAEEHVILKKQIMEGAHADTILHLDQGEGLSIETVRGILNRASQSHTSPYLIFIIENLGRLKPEACNALLKTLEEPGENVLFFLTANKESDVLPTIRSRCSLSLFSTIPESELQLMTKGHVFEKELLFFAMGKPGKLRRLLDDPAYFEAHQGLLQDVLRFVENPKISSVFDLVRKYEANEHLDEMLDILLRRAQTWELMDRVEQSKRLLNENVNSKLVLENLLLTFVP